MGRHRSFGLATRYGLDDPGIESRWGARFSAPVQTGPGTHPTSYTMGTGFQSGGAWLWHPTPSIAEAKERVELHFSPPPRAFVACCRVNFTFYVMYTELDSIFVDLCSWIYLEALKKKTVYCVFVSRLQPGISWFISNAAVPVACPWDTLYMVNGNVLLYGTQLEPDIRYCD